MTTPTRTRKPRQAPPRTIRLALRPHGGDPGVVEISVGNNAASYLLTPLPTDFGLGFELERFSPEPSEPYRVNLDPADGKHICECKGFFGWSHCKHVEGLLTLYKAGRLDSEPKTAA